MKNPSAIAALVLMALTIIVVLIIDFLCYRKYKAGWRNLPRWIASVRARRLGERRIRRSCHRPLRRRLRQKSPLESIVQDTVYLSSLVNVCEDSRHQSGSPVPIVKLSSHEDSMGDNTRHHRADIYVVGNKVDDELRSDIEVPSQGGIMNVNGHYGGCLDRKEANHEEKKNIVYLEPPQQTQYPIEIDDIPVFNKVNGKMRSCDYKISGDTQMMHLPKTFSTYKEHSKANDKVEHAPNISGMVTVGSVEGVTGKPCSHDKSFKQVAQQSPRDEMTRECDDSYFLKTVSICAKERPEVTDESYTESEEQSEYNWGDLGNKRRACQNQFTLENSISYRTNLTQEKPLSSPEREFSQEKAKTCLNARNNLDNCNFDEKEEHSIKLCHQQNVGSPNNPNRKYKPNKGDVVNEQKSCEIKSICCLNENRLICPVAPKLANGEVNNFLDGFQECYV